MNKKYFIYAIGAGIVFYLFFYWPALPAVGSSGRIGKLFSGSWDGTTATVTTNISNQQEALDVFNHYPAVMKIVDVGGLSFQRG